MHGPLSHTRSLLLRLLFAGLALCCSGCSLLHSSPGGVRPDRVTLAFWNGFTGPDGKTMERMVRDFRAANPDVDVRMQIIPWGTYYDKLTLALAYGGAPDVCVLAAGRLAEFAAYGTLRPLEREIATARPPLGKADFAPAPWAASSFGGRQYALPLDVHPLGLYCNADLFRAAGIVDGRGEPQPPATWDDFIRDARRLTRDLDGDGRPDQWGFVFTWQRSNWLTFLYQWGGTLLTPDGQHCALQSEPSYAALRQMHDLIDRYQVAPKPEGVDAWLAFRQGKVAMAMEGIYQLASLQEQTRFHFIGAPVPHFGPRPAAWGGSHLLCQPVHIDPRHVEPAWRLMRFLSDHSIVWAEGGQVPARIGILESPRFEALPVQAEFARELPYVRYDPPTPRVDALFQFTDSAVEAVLLDRQTPEAAMAEASRRIEQVLRRP